MKTGFISSKLNRLSRYKKLVAHSVFWLVNFCLSMHQYMEYSPGVSALRFVPPAIILTAFQALCVYSITLFLLPRFRQVKLLLFVSGSIAIIIITAGLETIAMNLYALSTRGRPMYGLLAAWLSMCYEMVPVALLFVGFVVVYEYYRQQERNKFLEKERLESELNFLKAQINPHFMFNALNSIYVLIRLRRGIAEDTVMHFSALLRYTLYECSAPTVALEREINFLDDYICLEKLRHTDLEVTFVKPNGYYTGRIAPLILIPFVENAFKHLSYDETAKNYIHLSVSVKEKNLHFNCTNTYSETTNLRRKGIGLDNIKRRLQLIYNGKHKLEIDQANSIFKINLVLYDIQNDLHYR